MKDDTLGRFGWFGRLWCRIVYGHVMVNVITHTGQKAQYMCARCLQTEILHSFDREPFGA